MPGGSARSVPGKIVHACTHMVLYRWYQFLMKVKIDMHAYRRRHASGAVPYIVNRCSEHREHFS